MSARIWSRSITLLLVIGFLLAGCAPPATPEPTSTPTLTASPSASPTATITFTPTFTAIPNLTATYEASIPEFYHGLAPTIEKFSLVNKTDIPAIMEYLRTQPSLLDPTMAPVWTQVLRGGGSERYVISCNEGGAVNCAVAGSIKYMDQEIERYVLIWELIDGNGPKAHILHYMHNITDLGRDTDYSTLLSNQKAWVGFDFYTQYPAVDLTLLPYPVYLTQQPGYQEAMRTLLETQNVPPQLQDGTIILPGVWEVRW